MDQDLFIVPANTSFPGSQAPIFLTPEVSLFAGPQVLGGTVLVETSPSPITGPWLAWGPGASAAGASIRLPQNGYARITAATQAATVLLSNIGGANQPNFGSQNLAALGAPVATPNLTTEQILFSLRLQPLFLPPSFRIVVQGSIGMTNNANVKSIACKVNGIAGTSFFTSPSLASNAAYNFTASFVGTGGGTLTGVGAGATGGLGLSTTAFTSLAFDYINQELEIVVTATKATGTDVLTLNGLTVSMA